MPSNVRDLVLLGLASTEGSVISGRTTIQKLTYFYGLETGVNTHHIAHFYGPYSREVSLALSSLLSMGMIEEQRFVTGRQHLMYSYKLTDIGKKIANILAKKNSREFSTVREITKKCEDIANLNPDVLSMAAKVKYIANESGKRRLTYTMIRDQAKTFGWKLSGKQIDSGANLLEGLGFGRRS